MTAEPSWQIGESGLGKSTLINTLFETKLYQPKAVPAPGVDRGRTVNIESISAGQLSPSLTGISWLSDIEEAGVRLKLTVVDTPGFGDFVNNDERQAYPCSDDKQADR
jgi:septin 7